MNRLHDLLLTPPIGSDWIHGLLFTSFAFHLGFVLLTLGTALLAVTLFIRSRWTGQQDDLPWGRDVLRTFLAHKSLAVVLGVGPLLLIQVGYTLPFFTSATLLAPYWLLIIVLLIVAFLAFDFLGQRMSTHPYVHIGAGVIALACLLIVPGIFVSVLVMAENPSQWGLFVKNGYVLKGPLALYWLFRYLHVLGAAVVFGALFHYFFTSKDKAARQALLTRWLLAGLLAQVLIGTFLVTSLPRRLDLPGEAALFVGIAAVMTLLWLAYRSTTAGRPLAFKTTTAVLMVVFIPMLLVRQHLQDQTFLPLESNLKGVTNLYAKDLAPVNKPAIDQYQEQVKVVYDSGKTIYDRSCSFCHGRQGDGNGTEAKGLIIPPEDLRAIRGDREYLLSKLVTGVPGSAMPYFSVFDRQKLDRLVDFLNARFHVLAPPTRPKVQQSDIVAARRVYQSICAHCHGKDGSGSAFGRGLKPEPPDFTRFTLQPDRAFKVITEGYPGTEMASYGSSLPEGVRWGLVDVLFALRH